MTVVREATAADFERLIELYGQLNPDDANRRVDDTRRVFDEISRADNLYLYVLADDAGHAQATCYLNIIPNISRGALPYGLIENVVTDSSQRGRGFGKSLMTRVLQVAWDKGCYKVMLLSGSRRKSVHGFYRACGFSSDEKVAFVARRPR